ncbi:unnamed protein product, partial [Ectocarpus sp. 6 AP-2014]
YICFYDRRSTPSFLCLVGMLRVVRTHSVEGTTSDRSLSFTAMLIVLVFSPCVFFFLLVFCFSHCVQIKLFCLPGAVLLNRILSSFFRGADPLSLLCSEPANMAGIPPASVGPVRNGCIMRCSKQGMRQIWTVTDVIICFSCSGESHGFYIVL